MSHASELSAALRAVIDVALPQLHTIGDTEVLIPSREGGWTRKQEMGHLIDSAVNNHVRFVVAALENRYSGPKYDADGWVELHSYDGMDWPDLVHLWYSANLLLARVVDRIPEDRLQAECRVGQESDAVTLRFLIEDYVEHMQGHLNKILPTAVGTHQ